MDNLDPLTRLPFPCGPFQVLEVLHLDRETLCASQVGRVTSERLGECLHCLLDVFYRAARNKDSPVSFPVCQE